MEPVSAPSTGPSIGTLSAPAAHLEREISTLDLVAGVLIGRDSRCAVGLREPSNLDSAIARAMALEEDWERSTGVHEEACEFGRLSRVHLLLLLDVQGLWAIDTASTNGTSDEGGEQLRTLRLDGATSLDLAGMLRVHWKPNVH